MTQEQVREDIGKLMGATASLAKSLDQLRHSLQRLDTAVTDNGQRLASVDSQVTESCRQLADLQKSIMHGNGQPALVNRVQHNADNIQMLQSKTKAIVMNCDRHINATILSRNQVIVALIGLVGAVVASCASLVVTLIRS